MPGSSGLYVPAPRHLPQADLDAVVSSCTPQFERLRGERILVTGGTGFVGRWLLETLLAANDSLDLGVTATVLSRRPDAFVGQWPLIALSPHIELLEGDVRTFSLPPGRFDRLLHLAAETNTQLSDPHPGVYLDVIVGGTRHVLDAADQAGVASMLLVSSGAIYGRPPAAEAAISEELMSAPDPTQRSSAYGESKRLAELLACEHARRSGSTVTIARCFAFVGPYLPLDSGFAVGNFIRDALTTGEIVVMGDGSPRRSYLYAADMAAWLWTIAVSGQSARPYNVGSDEAVSIADLARLIAKSVGSGVTVRIVGDSDRVGVGEAYVPVVERARNELGVEVTVRLDAAIRRTLAWHRQPILRAARDKE